MVADTPASDPVAEIAGEPAPEAENRTPVPVSVYSGHALVVAEVNEMARAMPTRVVLFAGPISSGKTTLITSLYESFRAGEFAQCLFAGSRTLLGFEQRCHLSRGASELDDPDTERTKAENEDIVLHLCVQRPEGTQVNLLLCDISGELFRAAGETNDAFRRIPFVSTASHVVLFIDGQKLADPAGRHGARQEFLTLLRGGIETGCFGTQTRLNVVFSKHDLVDVTANRDEVYALEAALEEECNTRFSPTLRSMTFHKIAARPKPNEEVAALFSDWLVNDATVPLLVMPPLSTETRQIDTFPAKEVMRRSTNDGATT